MCSTMSKGHGDLKCFAVNRYFKSFLGLQQTFSSKKLVTGLEDLVENWKELVYKPSLGSSLKLTG